MFSTRKGISLAEFVSKTMRKKNLALAENEMDTTEKLPGDTE